MNNISTSSLAIFIAIIAVFCASQARAGDRKYWVFGLKYNVHITNGFNNNSEALIVHCRSKHDDLGNHTLRVGEEISWSFKVRWDGSTLFYCELKHGNLRKHFNAFNAWIEGSRCAENGQCYWLVAEKGFYFSTNNFAWRKQFGW